MREGVKVSKGQVLDGLQVVGCGFYQLIVLVALLFISMPNVAYAYKLPDTGQTKCYQSVSPYAEISCAGTGQDGEYNINPLSYTDNGNGTITDNNTGLMWQKCTGYNYDYSCSGAATTYNWYKASGTYHPTFNPNNDNVCASIAVGGYTDWRLSSKKELLSIVSYGNSNPAINQTYFPFTQTNVYWTSTMLSDNTNWSWGVNFSTGGTHGYFNGESNKY